MSSQPATSSAPAVIQKSPPLSLMQVLICGGLIVTLSMGIRHGFGLWLAPITMDRGWPRESFALAMALQNLSWGLVGPITGMLADRFGAFRVLVVGALLYSAGLIGMAFASSSQMFAICTGLLIGAAQSGTTYAVVYGVIGRNIVPDKRSWAMGMAAAAGSFGQFLMVPVESNLISHFGWQNALVILGCVALVIVPLAWGLREPNMQAQHHTASGDQSIAEALREAFATPSFGLLMASYFVCGFQVVFIAVHMPSYLKDQGLPQVASAALALIGLFNVFGTYTAGALGQRLAKRHMLSTIYMLRAVVITVFVLAPISPASVYIFSAVMGFLWLSTVPLTNAIVAQVFGVRHLSMLGGLVFLSHQVGSFLGVWLGGRLYDATGSYRLMWWIAVALGVLAAILTQPVRESALVRPATAAA